MLQHKGVDTTRNLQINDKINQFLIVITTCDYYKAQSPRTSHIKFLSQKTICNTKSQWYLHEDATYMNFSSIQTNLHDIAILQLIYDYVMQSHHLHLFKYLLFISKYYYYCNVINIIFTYIYSIGNFMNFNLYHVHTRHYLGLDF